MTRISGGHPNFLLSVSSDRCSLSGRKPIDFPLSNPAWTSERTLSGGHGSPSTHESGLAGYCVLALMPTRSPSLTRLRQRDLPTGGRL